MAHTVTYKPSPNAPLVGRPGSRAALDTPCLVLDRAALDRNVATAARHVAARRIALRPHAKSHKCAAIARRQIAAGATGVCVATVGEAEALAHAGIDDLLITSTFTQASKIARAVALAAGGVKLTIVVDDPGVVDRLAAAVAHAGTVLPVLIDVDLGRGRNGIVTDGQALAVAREIAARPQLRLDGLQAYASHLSHVADYAERRALSEHAASRIGNLRRRLAADGHATPTVTGGSTGTLTIDADLDCYTELQAGSYALHDVEYAAIDLDGCGSALFEPALRVRVSVIGRNVDGRVTCDGGNKHFSAKGTLPMLLDPPARGASYRPDSDEHGILTVPDDVRRPALADAYELMVPHCDPTVNLYDHYHVVVGDTLVDIWPIEGRGAF